MDRRGAEADDRLVSPNHGNEPLGLEYARAQDRADPLARFREEFHIPRRGDGREEVYLCGHSLGLMPKRAERYVLEELAIWKRLGVRGHFEPQRPWMPYHELLTEPSASLVGAEACEVAVMGSLTANLHLMMVSFYRPTVERHKVLIEDRAFPSDRYAVESQIRFHGLEPASSLLVARPRTGEACLRGEDLAEAIEREGDAIALILLPGVQYYTGEVLDLGEITRIGHRRGCVVGFDLAHAAGNIPLALHDTGCDFACWCSYKYLNGGPGAVGGLFVHERHARRTDLPRLAGWWGHDKDTRFEMGPEFRPIPGAEGWQQSNPPILALAAVRAALEVFGEAGGMAPLREKSKRLTGFLESLLRRELPEHLEVLTPSDPARRGCQLSLRIKTTDGRGLYERITAAGIACDWREPDVIRVAPVPLYNRFEDAHRFVEALKAGL
ncbi:MAG: kynureninase [Gammaproteobacteria bacterium]